MKIFAVLKKYLTIITISLSVFSLLTGCTGKTESQVIADNNAAKQIKELQNHLENSVLIDKQRYSIINQLANNYLAQKDYQGLILFLTDWVEKNPDDMYNSYWLLMTAYAYLSTGAEPVAEYYFDKILQQSQDLLVKGNSVHFLCLQNLIQISKTPAHRIKYFNELINLFPDNVNKTELYLRLALEYQNDSMWEQALRTYRLFLDQNDATTIQIAGEPDAYKNARHFVDFYDASKDWTTDPSKNWTFESLPELEEAVKKAIKNYDWKTLDSYKAKVNFFSMSWKQDEMDANAQSEFSMRSFMRGNRIRFNDTLDEASTPNEAYLKTWGWSTYIPVWYLYFRKVNFPIDPDINGNWEWAGIYMGNKL